MSYDDAFFYEIFGSMDPSGPAGTVLAILGVYLIVVFLAAFIVGIVSYVLGAIGVFNMAKRRGIRYYGLAWVPYFDAWILGGLADQYDRKERGRDIPTRKFLLIAGVILLVMELVIGVVTIVLTVNMVSALNCANEAVIAERVMMTFLWIYLPAFLMSLLSIAYSIFYYIALYKVYKSCKPSRAVLFLVLSILFGIAPFFLFALRRKDEGYGKLNEGQPYGEPQGDAG